MIVDTEYTVRKNSRLKEQIKNAEFEQPDASIAAVDYGHNCKIKRHLIDWLELVNISRNIVIYSLPVQQSVERYIDLRIWNRGM